MREFFGLIIFVILISIWSWVFADPEENGINNSLHSNVAQITVEQEKVTK